jgi:CheY-like chemotaxis protein
MNIEWAKLLFTPFIYLLAAAIAIYVIWHFRIRLGLLVRFLGIKSLKVAGVEISMSSSEIDNAQAKAIRENRIDQSEAQDASEIAAFAEAVAPYVGGARVLWVDNNPVNNREERRAFRLLRIEVHNCLNTDEALEALCLDDYDLVISDIERRDAWPPCAEFARATESEDDSGWNTLTKIQERFSDDFPLIFYHGTGDYFQRLERSRQATEKGAIGATTSPSELYVWVLSAILARVAKRDKKLRGLLVLVPVHIMKTIKG